MKRKVPMCPNALTNPPLFTVGDWLTRHVEDAFEAMWAANYGVDTEDEKKALDTVKEIIEKYFEYPDLEKN